VGRKKRLEVPDLLESVFISRESIINGKYKQVMNLDFDLYTIKSVIDVD